MTKRLTLLLAAVFAWLFIGSLIVFHQEHVLGKHSSAISQHFIVPKSKENAGHYLKHQGCSSKINLVAGDVMASKDTEAEFYPGVVRRLIVSPLGLFSDHPPRMTLGLRAPPLA